MARKEAYKITTPKGKSFIVSVLIALAAVPFFIDGISFILDGQAEYKRAGGSTVTLDDGPFDFWLRVVREFAIGAFILYVAVFFVKDVDECDKESDDRGDDGRTPKN